MLTDCMHSIKHQCMIGRSASLQSEHSVSSSLTNFINGKKNLFDFVRQSSSTSIRIDLKYYNKNDCKSSQTIILRLAAIFSKYNINLLKLIFLLLICVNIKLVKGHSNLSHDQNSSSPSASQAIFSDENFTFTRNGSFLQLDAGREWPFNSKREISFRFKTKSSHGLLIYQTFDHSKLAREEEQDSTDQLLPIPANSPQNIGKKQTSDLPSTTNGHDIKNLLKKRSPNSEIVRQINFKQMTMRDDHHIIANADTSMNQLSSNTITATASERLVNSLFSSSPSAAINGNNPVPRSPLTNSINTRDKSVLTVVGASGIMSSKESSATRNHRVLNSLVKDSELPKNRVSYGGRTGADSNDGPTVLSSSAISSFSASMYELYLKLENGRLKIMYEFGSRLNQTYCGKGLNDDRWHKVDLKVDPELNQMILVLDQVITVEIVLSQQIVEDENMRRNELVFTNSVLYLGGLDRNTSIVKNVKQRIHLAQFIGCIGQILLKTDQHTEALLQPVPIDRLVLMKRGCINKCETDNYCLHKSTCINYYTHTKCDCFGTNYEDSYCWQDQLTTLSMLGYSTLTYRIYDWRDRHHSNVNRLSIQFKTLALDSILFFGYGDLSTQQSPRNVAAAVQSPSMIQTQTSFVLSAVNISNLNSIHRPVNQQVLSNSNYLAVSLSNGTIVVEVNFGDQPVLLSNLLYDKVYNRMAQVSSSGTNPTSNYYRPLNLSDGRWHNVTFLHNNKQLYLFVDNYSANYTIIGKNSHLYFDPTIYFGGVPNLLLNETRTLARPFNLRQKFVGCMRSVYFNQNNILLALKQESPMVEYRDTLGKPRLDSCLVREPSSLPLTMRSGKSYLTFQLNQNLPITESDSFPVTDLIKSTNDLDAKNGSPTSALKKLTRIEFEYRTPSRSHFLAGGHLRDLNYHDLGGFWTLHAREDCQLYFTISSGLQSEPEQIIKIETANVTCDPKIWNRISISMISGEKVLNVTRSNCLMVTRFEDEYSSFGVEGIIDVYQSYTLKSSVELLHQVQLGGDLAKFGESSSVPFTGCFRRIKINGHLYDSRDFVTSSAMMSPLAANPNPLNSSVKITQLDVISSRMAQGYVTLDSCQLVDLCASFNPCKNGGVCKINELGEPECDCSKTGYTGKRCHFSIYKQSCQDLYLSGQRKSAQYLIDLDRNGPLKPIRVRCNIDDGSGHIETVLSHNLPSEYLIKGPLVKDIYLDITYLAFNHMFTSDGFYTHDDDDENTRKRQDLVLRSLIGQSLYCRQYFRYECRSAPLKLGNKTWMEAPYPTTHKLTSLDGVNRGKCSCATTEKKCLNPEKNCNCDAGQSIWTDDSYELIGHEDVGLTRIVILKDDDKIIGSLDDQAFSLTESQSRFTLSDLKCYGTKQHESQHEITFKTSDAYIEVPGWRRGDISFSFRTASNPPAIILYQLATSRNHGYFRLTLISDTRLLFEFIVNRKPRKLYLTSTHKLNNGEWQQVFIEYDSVNLRITINDDSTMVDLDINDHLGTFEGPLYIGGAPSKYLVLDPLRRNGFTGCFRSLTIDGHQINLKSYLSPSMPTVTSSCKPSCSKNLCQNGGRCIEYWGSYECECSNPIAHSGSNCEINLNTNSITFVTQESYYVQVSNDSHSYPSYLIKNILLNIRTYQETALILYASDHLNNFIQLHKNGSSLVFTFNSDSTIIMAQVPINDNHGFDDGIANHASAMSSSGLENTPLKVTMATNVTHPVTTTQSYSHLKLIKSPSSNSSSNFSLIDTSIRVSNTSGSGLPIQVKIERHRLRTTFYVNNNFMVVEEPLQFLTNYTQNPWQNPELELVRPPRPKMGSKTYFQVFLANIDEYFSTRLPGFTGCIQGLSIDNQLFDFNRAHLTGELKGDYRIGCKMHCDSYPCKNHGTCIENWHENKIQCKCDTTSYVGRLCDEDIAAIFNGKTSYFLYYLSRKFSYPDHRLGHLMDATALHSADATVNDDADDETISLHKPINFSQTIHYLEISFAFSVDLNQISEKHRSSVQVLLLITQANSSKHFFLGLTSDGSLLIQEDYGNSMSLSRLIKRPDQPFNDGYRHIVKYLRYNQTIQIVVDYQTYLPTMSVITVNQLNKYSKNSVVLIGTSGYQSSDRSISEDISLDGNYTNYSGCISNLVIKMDDISIEPLSEAFGQNLETVNMNITEAQSSPKSKTPELEKRLKSAALLQSTESTISQSEITSKSTISDGQSVKTLSVINKLNGKEVLEDMETIVAKDVEQGKCSNLKKTEVTNEKRSINEPKHTQLLEPRPIYMDPPKIKSHIKKKVRSNGNRLFDQYNPVFYVALAIISVFGSLAFVYVYMLQMRYKSEKFRCDTPFFHKRDDADG